MGLAATVYAELLYRQGHGHPLWYPEPSEGLDGCVHEIHLGDVGYLDESGGFRRLFNITVPAEHELNKGGVPDSFTPVTFNPALRRRREKALDPGELCSEGVERVRIDGTFGADLMAHGGLKIGYTFKCSSHRGAFLDLKDHATKEWIELNPEFSDYMRRNHDSWYTFVTDPGKLGLQCSPEDIILVRGTMKTSSWTIGAFPGQTDRSNDIYGGGQVASIGKVKLRMERSHCESQKCVKRSGPGRAPLRPIQSAVPRDLNVKEVDLRDQFQQQDAWLVKDQCIFLSCHKIKYRKLLPKKIVANADPASFDTDNDSTSESSAVLGIDIDIDLDTEHVLPVTPLDDLLDYILECSDAEVAVASDADLRVLYPDGPIPTTFATILRERRPQITVNNSHAGQLDVDAGLPIRNNTSKSRATTERSSSGRTSAEPLDVEEIAAAQHRCGQSPSSSADHCNKPVIDLWPTSLGDPVDQGKLSDDPDLGCPWIPEFPQAELQEVYNAGSMKNKEKELEPDDKGDSHNLPVSQHDSIPVIYNLNFSENMRDTEQTSLDPSFFALDDAAYSPRRPTSTITRTPSGDRAPDSFAPIDISGNNSPGLSARTSYDFVSKDQPPSYLFSRNSESLLDIVSRFPDPGRIIPQKRYRPNIQSDRRRYVGEITLYPPIVFYAARSDTLCGISCSDALKTRFPPRRWPTPGNFELSGPPESVHIMWPGYAPWSGKILVRDFGAQPITRAKLAKNVANIIKNFIKAREKTPMDEDADPQYKVGTNHIRIEDLDLLGLEHVAPGSWQAHVRLRHRTEGPLHPVHSEARLRSESIEATHKQTPLEDGGNTKTDTKLPRDSSLLQPFQSDHPDSSIDGMQSVLDVHPPSWSTPDHEVQTGSPSQANMKDGDLEANSDATVLRVCTNCSTTNTPVWGRDAQGQPLCNACCMFYKLHGVTRPSSLRADVLKRRNWGAARPHEADVDG